MPKKKKLKLESLKVFSFITSKEISKIKGGGDEDSNASGNVMCFPCPETGKCGGGTDSCNTCVYTCANSCDGTCGCDPVGTLTCLTACNCPVIGTDEFHICIPPRP